MTAALKLPTAARIRALAEVQTPKQSEAAGQASEFDMKVIDRMFRRLGWIQRRLNAMMQKATRQIRQKELN